MGIGFGLFQRGRSSIMEEIPDMDEDTAEPEKNKDLVEEIAASAAELNPGPASETNPLSDLALAADGAKGAADRSQARPGAGGDDLMDDALSVIAEDRVVDVKLRATADRVPTVAISEILNMTRELLSISRTATARYGASPVKRG